MRQPSSLLTLLALSVALAVPVAACSSSSSGGSSSGDDAGDTGDDAGGGDDAASAVPTWSDVYANYFASGTPGHCGNGGCHATNRGGFKAGTDKDTCYQGLVAVGLVSTSKKGGSALASSSGIMVWFNSRGTMPQDNLKANAQAAADIKAWLASGATNN